MAFDCDLNFKNIDCRKRLNCIKSAEGSRGIDGGAVYLPCWRFKNPEIAKESSEKIYQLFLDYKEQDDFIGMDMACKFLQMGCTRSCCYANYKSGRKYDADGNVKE